MSSYMKLRNLLLISLAAVGFALSGCNTANDHTAQQKTTFWGIYTYEPGCFTPTSPYSLNARTDQITGMELPSGDRVEFLWGLVSLEDY